MTNLQPSNYVHEQAQVSYGSREGESNVIELHTYQAQASNSSTNVNYEASRSDPRNKYLLGVPVGNQGDKMAEHTREEVDAKIAASEARTDTKIARIEGKLDLVLSKLDSVRDDNRANRANQWIIGFGLAALMIAIVALLPVFFGIGAQVKDMVDHAVEMHTPITKK
jgi:hypothetical protein